MKEDGKINSVILRRSKGTPTSAFPLCLLVGEHHLPVWCARKCQLTQTVVGRIHGSQTFHRLHARFIQIGGKLLRGNAVRYGIQMVALICRGGNLIAIRAQCFYGSVDRRAAYAQKSADVFP